MALKETLEALKEGRKVIGIKQVTKAVNKGKAVKVLFAEDADERVTAPLKELCGEKGIKTEVPGTMKELGEACAIEVGAAAVALL